MSILKTDLNNAISQTLAAIADFTKERSAVRFASSLGVEDIVLADIISRNHLAVAIFTLDTGRLNPETYELLSSIKHIPIKVMSPTSERVEAMVSEFGINGFYNSQEARKACCAARKIEPLQRALQGADGWLTGLRKEQSDARQNLELIAFDNVTQLDKCNPLLHWTSEQIWAYVTAFNLTVNKLHSQGYPSIGCAPCTRAVATGEHPRAGRWWWESDTQKECGLHVDDSGKLVRTASATKIISEKAFSL